MQLQRLLPAHPSAGRPERQLGRGGTTTVALMAVVRSAASFHSRGGKVANMGYRLLSRGLPLLEAYHTSIPITLLYRRRRSAAAQRAHGGADPPGGQDAGRSAGRPPGEGVTLLAAIRAFCSLQDLGVRFGKLLMLAEAIVSGFPTSRRQVPIPSPPKISHSINPSHRPTGGRCGVPAAAPCDGGQLTGERVPGGGGAAPVERHTVGAALCECDPCAPSVPCLCKCTRSWCSQSAPMCHDHAWLGFPEDLSHCGALPHLGHTLS